MPERWNQIYYEDWVAREGLDLIRGYVVDNVYTVPLRPWGRTGCGSAVHIQLEGTGDLNGAYVCEIPPGKQLDPQRHLYEEIVYILTGRGSTSVWYDGQARRSFEWQRGSMFAVPLNAWYQHFNVSGAEPARFLAVTTAPITLNLIRDDDFIFNNPAAFPRIYDSREDYFAPRIRQEAYDVWDEPSEITFTNFVPDVLGIPFHKSGRAVGARTITWEVGEGVLGNHVLELPGGAFTNVHRHGPGAHVLWLQGEGYSLMWAEGGEKVKADWGPGTMLVPPSWWWHQHAVVSPGPALHLALKLGSKRYKVNHLSDGTMRSIRAGGSMLNFEDFPPELMEEVTRIFVAECEKRGTEPNLQPIYGV